MKKIVTAFLVSLIFSSCAPSTPQARIERSPAAYSALSPKDQELVKRGQIRLGMAPEAVILAWGHPDRRFEGSRGGKALERWDYSASRPIYTSYIGGYGFGRRGYSHFGYELGPEVAFIPYHVGSVWFVNRRVDSWERGQ
jgi:hypothetical protein